MKKSINYLSIVFLATFAFQMQAQDIDSQGIDQDNLTMWERNFPNFKPPNRLGVNHFEPNKDLLTDEFDGLEVRIGGASTIQFQALDHENEGLVKLQKIGDDFNLPTANLDLDVFLAKGVRMHLRTYLSSQHHNEAYVKGGYIQIDNLDFLSEGFANGIMEHVRIKVGHMENNYGDAHFRRTDNAMALYNPFVGNYLMDSFTTEVGAEVYYFSNGWMGMAGITNGKLNQSVTNPGATSPSLLLKLGFDDDITEDIRFRLTGSVFHSAHSNGPGIYLYSGDRAGSRYYNIMQGSIINANGETISIGDSFRAGNINPDLKNEMTAFMINPFLKVGGFEFFGIYERAKGKHFTETDKRAWNQYSGELIYRFGNDENLYVGGRYNVAEGETLGGNEVDVNRLQIAGGWYMTKNILAKLEYVNQEYSGYPSSSIHHKAKFNGLVLEAAISF